MKPDLPIQKRFGRNIEAGKRSSDRFFLDYELSRGLVGLALSLGVLVLFSKLPIYDQGPGIGWQVHNRSDTIELMPEPEELIEKDQIEGGLITRFQETLPEESLVEEEETPAEEEGADEPDPMPRITKLDRIEKSPILEFAEEGPAIIGGLGSLYLNIEYPKIARDAGIEGLAVLMFVVEENGSTSDITVLKSLHPACDSAAVVAVRRTLFKPGRQNGKVVRVKMRLPIRFRLIDPNIPRPDSLSRRSS
jgi:TonB family protein